MMRIIRESILWTGILFLSILFGGTVYQMMVIIPEFNRDIPNGMINFAQGHISTSAFWGSPLQDLAMITLIAAIILNWKNKRRYWLVSAAVFSIIATVITLVYAVPKLQILGIIDGKQSSDLELLSKTITSFTSLDLLRFWFTIIPSFLCYIKAISLEIK